jgi:WD40 repeat protein/tRNA A-37 threonylcarbamoyl transferase component Bud32
VPKLDCFTPPDLEAFQLGELPSRVAALISNHLEGCPACAALAEQFDTAVDPCIVHLRQAVGTAAPDREVALPGQADGSAHPNKKDSFPRPFGEYELLGEAGRGGMSVVYLARQKRPARVVALKMILAGSLAGAERRARFLAEADTIGRLHHPNIVQIFEVGEHDGQLYLALEWVNGGTLAQRQGGRPQEPTTAATLVEQLARAVHYAHEHGVVHRDLKPANILLGRKSETRNPKSEREEATTVSDFGFRVSDCEPKVADFGLAKQEDLHLTATSALLGTPAYMAPEQAAGDNRAVGPPADVHALGAILYELLTGGPPFPGASVLDILEQIRSREPVSPRQRQPRVPRDLSTICLKCLQKDPRARYASARELANDLRRFLDGQPILARPVGPFERAVKWVRANPVVAALLAAVALTLVAGTAVAWWLALEALAEKSIAETARRGAQASLLQVEQEKTRASNEWHRAETEKELAQHNLATSTLLRVGLMIESDPDGALALLHDQQAIPVEARDAAWGFYHNYHQRRFRILKGHTATVRALAWSRDGTTLAAADNSRAIKLWDVQTGRERATLKGHAFSTTHSLAWSFDGKTLASASFGDTTVKLWDAVTGQERTTLRGHTAAVTAVAWSFDGKILASASADGRIKLWDPATAQERAILKGHAETVFSLAWSRFGPTLASASRDKTIKLWDPVAAQELATLKEHNDMVLSVAWDLFGRTLASASSDGSIKLWDATSGKVRATLKGQTHPMSVAWSGDGEILASASPDSAIKLWDVVPLHFGRAVQERATLLGQTNPYLTVAWGGKHGNTLAFGGADATVKLWDVATEPARATLKGHDNDVTAVAWKDAQTLTSACATTIKLWDAVAGKELATLKDADTRSFSLAWSADGKTLASGAMDGKVVLWDVAAREKRATLAGHTGRDWDRDRAQVKALAWSADGKTLASGSRDGTVKFWDAGTRRERATLKWPEYLHTVAWSPDGKTVAASSFDQFIELRDIATGQQTAILKGHSDFPVAGLAWSPDGKTLASASGDRMVKLWDAASGRERAALRGHTDAVNAVAWSPDGKTLASAGEDGTIKLWDAASGQERATLRGHTFAVKTVAWSPDGTVLASGSADRTVKLWDLAAIPAQE